MAEEAHDLTLTCTVHGLDAQGLHVTYRYADGSTWRAWLPDVLSPLPRAELEARVRAEVRRPNQEEQAVAVTVASEPGMREPVV